MNLTMTDFINEVSAKHAEEKKNCLKRVRKGRFNETVKEVRDLRSMLSNIETCKATIVRRVQCDNLFFV